MTFRTWRQLIGLALGAVLILGLSACLPPETDSPSPTSTARTTSGQPTAQAATGEAATTRPTSLQPGSPSETTPHGAMTTAPSAAVEPPGSSPGSSPGNSTSADQPERTPEPQKSSEPPVQDPTVVSWVPTGPIGSNDPVPGQRYLMLQQFHCDALAQSVAGAADAAVWVAGAAVCRALQTGNHDDWQQASIAVARTPRIPQKQCLEFRVAATAALVVAQYRSNPGGVFKAEPGPGEACPRQLLGLTVVDGNLRPMIGMPRASGPKSGGTIVRMDGYYVRVGSVLFDGVPTVPDIVAGGGDYQTLYLRMPPAEGRETIRISMTDTVDVAGTVTFFYDDSPAPGSSPPPAAEPPAETSADSRKELKEASPGQAGTHPSGR